MFPKSCSVYGTRRPSILFWMVEKRESQFFSTPAIQSKRSNTGPQFIWYVKLSQVGRGEIQMFKKLIQVPNETKSFKEGEMQHVVLRGTTNFQPFLGKWELIVSCNVTCCHFCAFFLEKKLLQMTDANNYNLSNKLQRAQSWTVHFWSFKYHQSPTLIRGVIQTLSSILVKENLI